MLSLPVLEVGGYRERAANSRGFESDIENLPELDNIENTNLTPVDIDQIETT